MVGSLLACVVFFNVVGFGGFVQDATPKPNSGELGGFLSALRQTDDDAVSIQSSVLRLIHVV